MKKYSKPTLIDLGALVDITQIKVGSSLDEFGEPSPEIEPLT